MKMYAVVVGGGDVGKEIIKALVNAKWEVSLIEKDEKICREISQRFGINCYVGEGTNPDVLSKVELERANAFIACTGDENTNIISSLLAKESGVKKVITRLRSERLAKYLREKGILYFIPEEESARRVMEMVYSVEGMFKVDGIKIVKYEVKEDDKIVGKKIFDLPGMFSDYIIFAVRGRELEILDKEMVIDPGDVLYIATRRDIREVLDLLEI